MLPPLVGRKSIAWLLTLALVAVACGGDTGSGDGTGGTTTSSPATPRTSSTTDDGTSDPAPTDPGGLNPASIEMTIESGSAVSETVGFEGGSVTAISIDATTFTLIIPQGALFDDVEITMTPLASAEGEPIGDSAIAAVRLQPDGLHFVVPARLEIVGSPIGVDAVGFGAESEGENFHLIPVETSAGPVSIPVLHFSVAGIGQAQITALVDKYRPEGESEQVTQLLALDNLAVAGSLLIAWAELLDGRLANATGSELEGLTVDVLEFAATFAIWSIDARDSTDEQVVDLVAAGEAEVESLLAAWRDKVSDLVNDLFEFCQRGEFEAGFDIARWWLIGSQWLPDADAAPWLNRAKACFTFELTWTADAVNRGSGVETPVSMVVTGVVPSESAAADEYVISLVSGGLTGAGTTGPIGVSGGPFGVCTGGARAAGITLEIRTKIPNLGDVGSTIVEELRGKVSLRIPLDVVCPDLLGVQAPIIETFLVAPLRIANEGRSLLTDSQDEYTYPLGLLAPEDRFAFIANFHDEVRLGGTPSEFEIIQDFTVRAPPGQ